MSKDTANPAMPAVRLTPDSRDAGNVRPKLHPVDALVGLPAGRHLTGRPNRFDLWPAHQQAGPAQLAPGVVAGGDQVGVVDQKGSSFCHGGRRRGGAAGHWKRGAEHGVSS